MTHLVRAAFLCLVAVTLSSEVDGQAMQGRDTPAPGEAITSEKFGKTTVTKTLRVIGAHVEPLSAERAGYAFAAFPQVKRVREEELAVMENIPKSGLFIVGADYVPVTLMRDLKRDGYQLREDGVLLDEKGKEATMFVRPETMQVTPQLIGPPADFLERPALPSGRDESERGKERQGAVSPAPRPATATVLTRLESVVRRVRQTFLSEVQAASPFPFTCFTWYWRWKYEGGFCRDYRAWTDAYAWGPGTAGGCSGTLPHTNIAYIRTYARAANDTDDEHCYACDEEHAAAKYDLGCFWPAHGKGSGYHFIHMIDGSIQIVRSASWQH